MNNQSSENSSADAALDGLARPGPFDRRTLLIGGSLAAAGAIGAGLLRDRWRQHSAVVVADAQHYGGPLARVIAEGLIESGLQVDWLAGRRVLLKPNLVEPARQAPHMTTHPAVVLAAAEVFRKWGAHVVVGEAPGHVRDTQYALDESGMGAALREAKVEFADLNYEQTAWVANRGRQCPLEGFHLPRSIIEADLIVSMPKMKTHHWMGVTASMKNLYGVIPGIKYGWPKNVLHHAGIPETVYDINASLPRTIAIVDAIDCMEGDGPIMGTARTMGLLVMGLNPTAVDATICRLMQIDPYRIPYLRLATNRLGPVSHRAIQQRGADWRTLSQPFALLDQPHLRTLRADPAALVT